MEVMKEGEYSQVSLATMKGWAWTTDAKTKKGTPYKVYNYPESEKKRLKAIGIENYAKKGDFWGDVPAWPLFSLNPSLFDLEMCKKVLPFPETLELNQKPLPYRFEMLYACRFVLNGGTRASLDKDRVSHNDDGETTHGGNWKE
jgi:hypothetical protein